MTDPSSNKIRRILLYAQDSHCLGHISRTLTITRHLLAAHPDMAAYIATKSPIASLFTLPKRCDYIKTPTRLTPAAITQTAEEEEAAKVHFRKLRGVILRDVALGLAPELVLVDHEPLGSSGEFRDGLYALKTQCPETKFVFGMRDIMDDAARFQESWRELGFYTAFEDLYDGIAVYGSARLYDVAEAYGIPPAIQPKLHYAGYIVRELPACDPALIRQQQGLPPDGPLVLATVGSGSDGYPMLDATRSTLERLKAQIPDLVAMVVTGPFMPPEHQATLQAQAATWCRVVPRTNTFQLMSAADVIVSMGGYNSVCEALAMARPLVIVPRATHKIEQQIRAETLAAHGLARWVHPKELNGESLANALMWALQCDRRAYAARVHELIPSFDGAARLTAYLSRWLGAS